MLHFHQEKESTSIEGMPPGNRAKLRGALGKGKLRRQLAHYFTSNLSFKTELSLGMFQSQIRKWIAGAGHIKSLLSPANGFVLRAADEKIYRPNLICIRTGIRQILE